MVSGSLWVAALVHLFVCCALDLLKGLRGSWGVVVASVWSQDTFSVLLSFSLRLKAARRGLRMACPSRRDTSVH